MKKLIFFDIDGTIITEGPIRVIPDSLPKTLLALRENGHLCFINTGRVLSEIETAIRNLPFDGYICGCGTYIAYHGQKLFEKTFPSEMGSCLINDLENCHLEWLLEGTQNIYYRPHTYTTHIGDFKKQHQELVPDSVRILVPGSTESPVFNKFCICVGKQGNFRSFYEKYKDVLTFIDRKNNFYEIMPKGCSKATGIRFLEEQFELPHEDTIAIGDSTNDLPMLKYAHYSIAMGNGAEELLPFTDYVTNTVTNDGIYKAMLHLGLIS